MRHTLNGFGLLAIYCLFGVQYGATARAQSVRLVEAGRKHVAADLRNARKFVLENQGVLLVLKTPAPLEGLSIQYLPLKDTFDHSRRWTIQADALTRIAQELHTSVGRLIVTNVGVWQGLWLEFNQELIVRFDEKGAIRGMHRLPPVRKQGTAFEYGRNYYKKRWQIAGDGRLWYAVALEHAGWRARGVLDSLPWLEITPETYAATTAVVARAKLPAVGAKGEKATGLKREPFGAVSDFYRANRYARHALYANFAPAPALRAVYLNQAAEPEITLMSYEGEELARFGEAGRHFEATDTVCLLPPELFPKYEEFVARSPDQQIVAHNLFCRQASAYYGALHYLPKQKWLARYYVKGVADSSVFENINSPACRLPAPRAVFLQIYDAADGYALVYDEPVPENFRLIGTDEAGDLRAVTGWRADGAELGGYKVERKGK